MATSGTALLRSQPPRHPQPPLRAPLLALPWAVILVYRASPGHPTHKVCTTVVTVVHPPAHLPPPPPPPPQQQPRLVLQ